MLLCSDLFGFSAWSAGWSWTIGLLDACVWSWVLVSSIPFPRRLLLLVTLTLMLVAFITMSCLAVRHVEVRKTDLVVLGLGLIAEYFFVVADDDKVRGVIGRG